jgi:hypothetical protein
VREPRAARARQLAVLRDLLRLRSEAVDVEHERHAGRPRERGLAPHHVRGELVHHEQLLRQAPLAHDRGQPRRYGVHDPRVHRAEHLARHLPGPDVPLGVERQAHVRLAQERLERPHLGEEVRPPGLDVEQQQRLRPPRRRQVAAHDRRGLTRAIAPVAPGRAVGHHRYQLEHGQHRSSGALVRARLTRQPAARLVRRADAECPELAGLRRAVERHEPEARQDPPPPARELRRRCPGPVLAGATGLALVPSDQSRHEHDQRHGAGQHRDRPPPPHPRPPPSGRAPPGQRLAVERAYPAALRVPLPT